ncbi:MAG: FAD-dependent oxidoreductase [Gemmatimonadota bacterium]
MAGHGGPTGPDLTEGVPEHELEDGGMLVGHVGEENVLLVRRGEDVHAVGATCTHYGGPLGDGLVVGDTVRCPWHHACFSLRTGEALGAPALNDVPAWKVERRNGRLYVAEKRADPIPARTPRFSPDSVLILGGGPGGQAAAEQLRREGYTGPITMIDSDADEPYDKPNLSKDYLAGNAPAEWIPLRGEDFFEAQRIERLLGREARAIDTDARSVTLDDGSARFYDRLLIATGATPRRFPEEIAGDAPIHYLRTFDDAETIIASAEDADSAVVIGASFIGLEVAASLRERGLGADVLAPEEVPLAGVLGERLGRYVRTLHEERGVRFRLGTNVSSVEAGAVLTDEGERLEADLVVAGIGVEPRTGLAEAAGLAVDDGIVVNDRLETDAEGVYAAGDVARFPDHRDGRPIRIEHWVLAQRMGQHAARNILGADAPFADAPFFWSRHYDAVIAYVGHAEGWDAIEIDGEPEENDCAVRFLENGDTRALATIFRDRESLEFEAEIEGRRA